MTTDWAPLDPLAPGKFKLGSYAVLVLNCPIELSPSILLPLWEAATKRCTVDGGTDRWLNYLGENQVQVADRFPDVVSGDFDSIKPETLGACRDRGCQVVETHDQNYTDFEKALRLLSESSRVKFDSIVTICEGSGRVDQFLSNLNALRLGQELNGKPSLYLLSRECLTWHLTRGKHVIRVPRFLIDKKQWCAILPYEPKENQVSTTGLKWNLEKQTIKFGGLISSSNTYSGDDTVTIQTDAELLWSMGL